MGVGKDTGSRTGSADSVITGLVSLVAEAKEVEPLELPPLYETIDPEAVQRILESNGNRKAKVNFRYAGCEVTVTGAGAMFIRS